MRLSLSGGRNKPSADTTSRTASASYACNSVHGGRQPDEAVARQADQRQLEKAGQHGAPRVRLRV